MKNIFKIFKRDIKKIFTNSMAIILVVGVAVLPSLYAWFNIYANWDPYGNTGNMKVAVVIEDAGYSYKGITVNVGDEIKNNLRANDSIDWQFVSKKDAVNGIKSGRYYAAIEIPADFSKSLTSIMTKNFVQPQITYYANEKKNAIATKITDKVVQTVQTSVNESFVTTVVNVMNGLLGTVVESAKRDGSSAFDTLQKQIDSANKSVESVDAVLDSFEDTVTAAQKLNSSLRDNNLEDLLADSSSLIDDASDAVVVTQTAVSAVTDSVEMLLTHVSTVLNDSAEEISALSNRPYSEIKTALHDIRSKCDDSHNKLSLVIRTLEKVNQALPKPLKSVTRMVAKLKKADNALVTVVKSIDALTSSNAKKSAEKISAELMDISASVSGISSDYRKNISPSLNETVTTLMSVLTDVSTVLDDVRGSTSTAKTLSDALNESVSAGDSMLDSLRTMLKSCHGLLSDLSVKLSGLSDNEIVNTLLNLTEQNSDELGEFIACPVEVNTDKVYGIENYGSAMAPFYTTLAIWVGGIVLVAILQTNVKNKKEIGNVTPTQEYFGRMILFLCLAVVQSLIICLGDLYFLKIQCYHPIKFIFAGVVGALIFDFFIYSLTAAFGDIGKAIAVIMLVVQLGGCGGTFPVDVTPAFFRTLNPYMPFTFLIEALRECICGTYGNAYTIWLLKLCAYLGVGLLLGTLVRFTVRKPMKYFSKRIEETGLF